MFKKTGSKIPSVLTKNNPIIPGVSVQLSILKKSLLVLLIILALGGSATAVHYYRQYTLLRANPNIIAEKETARIVSLLGKMMELPIDEIPTMATITDKEKLNDQPFFSKTENGDIILAYNKALQAILYRPSTNKIIAVAPMVLTPQDEVNRNNTTVPTDAALKIVYYNGTETVGFSGQMEQKVISAFASYQTGSITNAAKRDYRETLIVDLTGTHTQAASDLAVLLGGKVASLPAGEARPDADILVIAGK